MKQKIEKKLQELLNRTVNYSNRPMVILGYDFDDAKERVYIHTNERNNHWDRPYDSCMQLLKEFTLTDNQVALQPRQTDAVLATTTNLTDKVQDILLDNISKIQADPEYIAQAKAINNNVNSLINLNKLRLSAMLSSEKLNGK